MDALRGSEFVRYGDTRVSEWPLMGSPLSLLGILSLYLYIIYGIGPAIMKNRPAYNLKWLLAAYNLIQVAACATLISAILYTDWATIKFWQCQSVDYRINEKSIRVLTLTYYTFLLKLVELIETVVFVLRKKQNQISKLHVYHHASTAILGWLMVKYIGGGMVLFSIVLNSFVHVIMYSYYFAALFGPAVQRALNPVKKCITIIQMIQFTIILIQCVLGIARDCDVPRVLIAIYAPNVLLIFYMFYDFFKTAYRRKNKDRHQNNISRGNNNFVKLD